MIPKPNSGLYGWATGLDFRSSFESKLGHHSSLGKGRAWWEGEN